MSMLFEFTLLASSSLLLSYSLRKELEKCPTQSIMSGADSSGRREPRLQRLARQDSV
jgi:hypothetical protein